MITVPTIINKDMTNWNTIREFLTILTRGPEFLLLFREETRLNFDTKKAG
jgi:hypothetical protein